MPQKQVGIDQHNVWEIYCNWHFDNKTVNSWGIMNPNYILMEREFIEESDSF